MYISLQICYNINILEKVYLSLDAPKGCEIMALTEQRKESMYKYAKNNLKRIPLDVQKEKYEEIKTAATAAGESVNGYIKEAINQRILRDSE